MKRSVAVLGLFLFATPPADPVRHDSLVAQYHFDEGAGLLTRDATGNGQDGTLIGDAKWVPGIRGTAILFDGRSRVSIPTSPPLNLQHEVTISAWIKGHSQGFQLVKEPSSHPSIKGPYFQVVGDVMHFVSFSDRMTGWWTGNESHLFTGTTDINLSHWGDIQRTRAPLTGDEPKLQVVGNKIYYEYMGQDSNSVWQIWTAQSTVDGSDFHAVRRTNERAGFRVEQGAVEVVGDDVYYAWPQKDTAGVWQTWTATSHTDGSAFKATQRTRDGGAFVYQQVVGNRIYYLVNATWGAQPGPRPKVHRDSMEIVVSDINDGEWTVLKSINVGGAGTGSAAFQVNSGKIYFAFIQADKHERVHLFTGNMRTDGLGFHAVQRRLGTGPQGMPGVRQLGVRVIGDRVYYALVQVTSISNIADQSGRIFQKGTVGRDGVEFWTAEAKVDDSQWTATRRTTAPPDIGSQYKSIDVVGGKVYYALAETREYREPWDPWQVYFATSGSNIVNKGDAYGIGFGEGHQARAFVNAGEDYLYRAEAPDDVAGATADAQVDENWHFVVTTYDEDSVRLYVDGGLRKTAHYQRSIGSNPFPLIIGDGFVGVIDEVSIYSRALSPAEILESYETLRAQ